MIEVGALDDELTEAHAFRHQHIEGYQSQGEQTRELRRRFGINPGLACKYPKTHLLAAIAGKDPDDYVRRHTMLPLSAAVPCVYGQQESSTGDWLDVSCHVGFQRTIDEVRICIECVDQDVSRGQIPRYRRSHHIRGTSRCPEHGICLHEIRDRSPFGALPTHWIESNAIQVAHDIEALVPAPSWILRYRSICVAMLESPKPKPCTEINEALIAALDADGLSTNIRRKKPLVSDLIRDRAGKDWVAKHMTLIHSRPRGEVIPAIDGLTEKRREPRTWIVYAAMWACLSRDPWTNAEPRRRDANAPATSESLLHAAKAA